MYMLAYLKQNVELGPIIHNHFIIIADLPNLFILVSSILLFQSLH